METLSTMNLKITIFLYTVRGAKTPRATGTGFKLSPA